MRTCPGRDFSINIRIVYHIIPCTSHSRFLILTFLFTPLVLSFAPLLCLRFHVDLVSSCIICVRTAIGRTACSVRDIHKFVMLFISPCHLRPYERGPMYSGWVSNLNHGVKKVGHLPFGSQVLANEGQGSDVVTSRRYASSKKRCENPQVL